MNNASGIRAGRAFVELGVNDKFTKGIEAAQKKLKDFGESVRTIGVQFAAIGGAAVTALGGAVAAFSKIGSDLNDLSGRTGVSVEALSELNYAAGLTGVSMESLEKGIRNLGKTVVGAADGSSKAQEALAAIGLTAEDLMGLKIEDQFSVIANRLGAIEDPATRATYAMGVFGKSGSSLLPMLKDGAAGLDEMRSKARELGLTISTDAASAADELGDSLDTLWAAIKRATFGIGAALAPAIQQLVENITVGVSVAIRFIDENKELIVTAAKVAAGVLALGVAIVGLSYAMTGLGVVIGAVTAAATFLATPVAGITAAVLAAGAAFLYFSGVGGQVVSYLSTQFAGLGKTFGDTSKAMSEALKGGDIQLAAKILWMGLKLAWQTGTSEVTRIWYSWLGDLKKSFVEMYENTFGLFKSGSIDARIRVSNAEIDAATAAAIAASRKELEATRAEFQAMIDKAKGVADKARRDPADRFGDNLKRSRPFLDSVITGYSVRGTFNPSALQGLQVGGLTFDRIARATEETSKNTKQLIGKLDQGELEYD